MPKYEYKMENIAACDILHYIRKNEEEGWQFITAIQVDIRYRLYFKKPISDEN